MMKMTRSSSPVHAVLVACAILLAACAGPTAPVPGDDSAASAQPATVTVSNEAGAALGQVSISACGAAIGATLFDQPSLDAGAIATWSVPAGCYDISAQLAGGSTAWLVASRTVSAGAALTVHLLPAGRLTVDELETLVIAVGHDRYGRAGNGTRAAR